MAVRTYIVDEVVMYMWNKWVSKQFLNGTTELEVQSVSSVHHMKAKFSGCEKYYFWSTVELQHTWWSGVGARIRARVVSVVITTTSGAWRPWLATNTNHSVQSCQRPTTTTIVQDTSTTFKSRKSSTVHKSELWNCFVHCFSHAVDKLLITYVELLQDFVYHKLLKLVHFSLELLKKIKIYEPFLGCSVVVAVSDWNKLMY